LSNAVNRGASVRKVQAGFTLIEVLIAATVLAVGLLGAGALLAQSLKANVHALQRGQAVFLIGDLAERIRSDATAASAFALDEATALPPPSATCMSPGSCAIEEVAAVELYRWQQALLALLPDARASIEVAPAAAPNVYGVTITVSWSQSGDDSPASLQLTVQV
jgi:type IV pilus assembly protein PilV